MALKIRQAQEKYFYLIFWPLAIAIEWSFAASHDWSVYPRSEWVMLVDLCLFVPLVYCVFFARSLPLKARLIRSVGIAGVGLFVASLIVPPSNQFILSQLTAIRNAVIIFVIALEAWVFWKIVKVIFAEKTDEEVLARDFAIPPLIARLMILEAKLWKMLWRIIRRT